MDIHSTSQQLYTRNSKFVNTFIKIICRFTEKGEIWIKQLFCIDIKGAFVVEWGMKNEFMRGRL